MSRVRGNSHARFLEGKAVVIPLTYSTVEPADEKNKDIYIHYGFNEYIKSGKEYYPDGTVIDVEYYGKTLE